MLTRAGSCLLALALLAGACARLPSGVVASVNGEPITADRLERQLNAEIDRALTEFGALPAAEHGAALADVQRRILSSLIQAAIVRQAATARGIEVSAAEIDAAWEEAATERGGVEALREQIAAVGLTEEEARELLAVALQRDMLEQDVRAEVEITEEQLRAAYEQRRDEFRLVHARHILVASEEEALEVIALLEEGADFGEVAGERSRDAGTAGEGGRLPPSPRGRFLPAFDEAVWSARAGEVVGPVETSLGFHVIRVDRFETARFAEVRDRLRAELSEQAVRERLDAFLREHFEQADVRLAPRFGRYDPATGTVVREQDFLPGTGRQEPAEPALPEELLPSPGAQGTP